MAVNGDSGFEKVPTFVNFPEMEEDTLKFWKEKGIFRKLREQNAGKDPFVFLEGPPTANGVPHVGHATGRALKDVFLRQKAMSGFDVIPWMGGWDCHGLPVEIEVEKELGLSSKKEIIEYGIKEFNNRCRKSVMRYEDVWKNMSERLGFWIDMDDPYVTMTNEYIESVWWSLKTLYDKDLLEKGHYIVPYCPRCGTPLSSHEVAQGYRDTKELSVTLKFKLAEAYEPVGENAFILAWTTTPWTLPGNVALAVGKDILYAMVEQMGERYILAMDLVDRVIEGEYELLGTLKGGQMLGWKYEPLFHFMDLREEGKIAYEVVAGDFVTTEEGTGVVHTAVMYGEEDYNLGMEIGLPARHTVDMEGRFNELVGPWAGRFVKEDGFDLEIAIHLYDYSRLYSKANYTHSYPFCWRCDSPLLYYGLDSWFVRMSRLRKELLDNNEKIYWKPEHLKHGRFGNFLEEVKDWALSRNRFWGTPLPVWNCECEKQVCIGSISELEDLTGELSQDFEPHRPWVDDVEVKCPECGKIMEREQYVIDTWYDSGSAPFAQFHYPFENEEMFKKAFPADFITEALDQTRGWFYTLLAVSTSVFDETPYLNCLTQGLMLNDEGLKMSKSKGTAIDPFELMSEHGADTLRLALFYPPCWASTKFGDQGLKDARSKVVTTLWNVYSFFVSNANLDGFKPPDSAGSDRMLDRWIISRFNTTLAEVENGFERLEVHKSVRAIFDFVDDLSNWYLRRSRRRFWSDEDPDDKLAAHSTLYKVLCGTAGMMAPITPFMAEALYQNLVAGQDPGAKESVHLTPYPKVDASGMDAELEAQMSLVRKIAEAGRNARQSTGIKLRQPLSRAVVATDAPLPDQTGTILREELNVKEVGLVKSGERPEANGMAEVEGQDFVLLMDTDIPPELLREGMARDVVRRIQSLRKELDLKYDQPIDLGYAGDDEMLQAIEEHREYIAGETLSKSMNKGELPGAKQGDWKIQGKELVIWISPL